MRITKMMIVTGLVAGVYGSVFASGGFSINTAIKNQQSVTNTAVNTNNTGSTTSAQNNVQGTSHNNSQGSATPQCVPEPASLLAIGLGAGILAFSRRRAAKQA
ncbi:MAG TPA: PEP-CTERM sorting domain-containing protein [Fimbriimonadaceae bacterium]|nr:PEP-CTERM sorting domain-containing protein [Fimbriimonadaceae bacterium]